MKLIGAPLSPFVRKARIVALEKGISHDFDPSVSPMSMAPEFSDINPLRRIPALVVRENDPLGIINDSSAICAYFDRLVPNPPLMPEDAFEYGRMAWLEEFADSGLAETIGGGVFRPVLFNALSGKAPDLETVTKTLTRLREIHFPYLVGQLGGRYWFGGEVFSLADIAIGAQLVNLMHVGYRVSTADGLGEFLDHFLARASVASLLDGETKALAKMGFEAPDLSSLV